MIKIKFYFLILLWVLSDIHMVFQEIDYKFCRKLTSIRDWPVISP